MSLSESMLLWLPSYIESAEQSAHLIEQVTTGNGAILDFCNGESSLVDTLEIIEYYGANIDDYRKTLAENLDKMGA